MRLKGHQLNELTAADAIRNAEARVREALPAVCAVYLQPGQFHLRTEGDLYGHQQFVRSG